MKVLITGANGFIGTYLQREFARNTFETDAYGVDLLHGDLTKPHVAAALLKEFTPDVVVHLAGLVGRLFGERDPALTITTNTIATCYMAQACADAGIRLAYASTSEAYGDQGEKLVPESDYGVLPHNLYGLTKRHAEEVCRLYMPPENLQIFRLSMPYGPGLPAGKGRAALLTFLFNAIHEQPIIVHKDAKRCWCYVEDTVRGIVAMLNNGGPGAWLIGRIDNETSMYDVAIQACKLAGKDPTALIQLVDAPSNQTLVKRLNPERLMALGWKPEVDLDEGMRRCYEAMLHYSSAGRPPWRQ